MHKTVCAINRLETFQLKVLWDTLVDARTIYTLTANKQPGLY